MADIGKMSKAELVEFIGTLTRKIEELKQVEASQVAESKNLKHTGLGIVKDESGLYSLVKLVYDLEQNAAQISGVEKLNTRDEAIVLYQAKIYLGEKIFRKARGGVYDEK